MSANDSLEKFTAAVFVHLPLFFSRDASEAQAALNAAGYRMARQPNGQPMVALPLDEGAVCLFATPDKPLPKAKLVGEGAALLFDRFVAEVEGRGFQSAASGTTRPGMIVKTFSATEPGPIMVVTIMRLEGSDNVLLAAAFPPMSGTRAQALN